MTTIEEDNKADRRLKLLPCLDSEEMAEARKQELWIPRHDAAFLGKTAVQAAKDGYYSIEHADGTKAKIDWADKVQKACAAKRSIPPRESLPRYNINDYPETRVQVVNETTLQAAKRLISGGTRPLALNFANGIHPGGGFLSGARAQEECLCRCSALYETLVRDPMYEFHKPMRSDASSNWAILSPDVPVFRDDSGRELEEPWNLSFVSCAAPYGPSVGIEKAAQLLKLRIHRILQIAAAHGYSSLVLGAWGCGAFGLDPKHTAQDFRRALEQDCFAGVFSDVIFAIADWSHNRRFLGPFRDVFAPKKERDDVPPFFLCPLTGEPMMDPVIDREGNTYERSAIEGWLAEKRTSPLTQNPLAEGDLVPNKALRHAIQARTAKSISAEAKLTLDCDTKGEEKDAN